MRQIMLVVLAVALLVGVGGTDEAAAQEPPNLLEVGADAPDFALPGATRFGSLRDPVRLSDFRGEAVVIAFFYRARTRG